MLKMFALYLLVMNAATFASFAIDKQSAGRGARRIPERQLLTLAALGGTAGALAAQRMLRHKTRKEPFRTRLWLLAALHLVLLSVASLRFI